MSKLLRSLVVLGLAGATVALTAPAASARPPSPQPASSTASTTGYDVSYPQCSSKLPTGQAFGIVGVNGGKATTANPCLTSELNWTTLSTGAVAAQPKAQLYLNTADPGQVINQVNDWPSSGSTPYQDCTGGNTPACSWEYGYERASASVGIFEQAASTASPGVSTDPSTYTWWLDVETANTWETGDSAALANNRAALEGWTAYLQQKYSAKVGIYSTATQWKQIVGSVPTDSPLATTKVASWLAGATSQNGAKNNCSRPALVPGGAVTLAQYVSGGVDRDLSCV